MKIDNITYPSEKIRKIADYVLNQKLETTMVNTFKEGPYTKVFGTELKKKFNYDFISDNLEININYDKTPMNKPDNIDEFWGNKVIIDIDGHDSSGKKLSKKEIFSLLVENLKKYYDLMQKSRHTYSILKGNDQS